MTQNQVLIDRNAGKFKIMNWTCPCKETDRTGVPCPHLIVAASTYRKSILSLFDARWRKQLPKAEAKKYWLMQGVPLPSRRNHNRKKRSIGTK